MPEPALIPLRIGRDRRDPPPGVAPSRAAISLAALVAVGGTACSSAAAPPTATPGTDPTQATDTADPTEPTEVGGTEPGGTIPASDALAAVAGAVEAGSVPARARAAGPSWRCTYLAVGAASGSTLELRIDDLGDAVTPTPDQVVALTCHDRGTVVHQEIMRYDPQRPLGSLDP